MKSRKIIIRLLTIAVLVGIAAWMFVIGRGHTVYFDNKPYTSADGTVYESPYQIQVFVGGESAGKLKKGDRGMASCMGQDFYMELHITQEKGGKKTGSGISLKLPYNMDGIILNLPALLGGAPEEEYMSEFIPAAPAATEEDETVITDEFTMPLDE